MHRWWVVGWSVCASIACSFNAGGVTVGNQGVDDGTTGTSTAAAATTDATPTPTTGESSGDGTGAGGVCSPGAVTPCACPDGDGAQTCSADGLSQGPCDCPAAPTTTAVDPDTTATTAVDPDTATTAADTSTTDPMEPCTKDKDEPNDAPDAATQQPKQNCDDAPEQFAGILESDGDLDWHVYDGSFPQQCNSGLQARMAYTLSADPQVRLCVFTDCAKGIDGNEVVVCGGGSTPADDTPGPGCCGQGDFDMFLYCVTDTFDHSAKLTMRVDSGPAGACSPYTVSYVYP